ncbi:hypothetical protein ABE66_08430 [Cytobacillus firmus]|nr:hypothetical protein [Cytobacillus firmus]
MRAETDINTEVLYRLWGQAPGVLVLIYQEASVLPSLDLIQAGQYPPARQASDSNQFELLL